jgi:hypothetical protein
MDFWSAIPSETPFKWRRSERAGYGRRRRKRHKRYKGVAAVEVNARRKREAYFRPRAIL